MEILYTSGMSTFWSRRTADDDDYVWMFSQSGSDVMNHVYIPAVAEENVY